ncbi:MAG TPA: hypothetical protein DD671_17005, partial [Balneolaceae bacterium]|nr:hypothetical protein [Balneolaceae bacterium]
PILNNHIKWIGNRELLVKLINSLKQEYFIEAQETEDIADLILNRTTDKQQVNWLKKKSLLAYLIESLNEVLISPDNIWADTAPYFLWKGETVTREQLSSSADQYKNNKNMKPLNHEVIDKIIERIKNIDHH